MAEKTLKVSEQYLKDFAKDKLGAFLEDLQNSQGVKDLGQFAAGVGGESSPGHYGNLLAGGGKLSTAKDLQTRFHDLCGSLQKEIENLRQTCTKMSVDLQTVSSILSDAEDKADLTAAEMWKDIADIVGTLNPTVPTPSPTTTTSKS
ncbi:hypothetical protein ACF07Y_37030 [Streptomyces sp. NPDC016566]|uniref:hypothetical protein n=1 Tax=Streptomyces sp. NPDC016566 TaxID=3364967 RepID=UPI0036FF97ED